MTHIFWTSLKKNVYKIGSILWRIVKMREKKVSGTGVFLNYILLVIYSYYNYPKFPALTPPSSTPHSLKQSPYTCPWVMCISYLATPFPILYFASPWLFCNYLFILHTLLTSSPLSPASLPSSKHQSALCICDSVSVLLVCLVCFLDSIVDRDVFLPFYCW